MVKIDGYEYYVNSEGEVFNRKGKKLLPRIHTGGYLRVSLCCKGIATDFYIHRLVAKYHIDNPENYPEVNHLDGNKKNNSHTDTQFMHHV